MGSLYVIRIDMHYIAIAIPYLKSLRHNALPFHIKTYIFSFQRGIFLFESNKKNIDLKVRAMHEENSNVDFLAAI